MADLPIFIDGVRQIHFMAGTIRMELFYNQPTEYDDKNSEKAGALIMTPDGFIAMLGALEQTAEALVEKGILKRETTGAATN